MRGTKLVSGILVSLGIGCAVGATTSSFVVPPAQAGSAKRWEAMCVSAGAANLQPRVSGRENEPDGWNPMLAKMGAEGWEPFATNGEGILIQSICFKRPASELNR